MVLFSFEASRFFFESSRRIDYAHVRCPVLEAARGTSIGFPQTVLLSDQAALDDFIEAVHKVRNHLAELKRLDEQL